MSVLGGQKSWFTAAELAELKLRGLPTTKRKVNELARDGSWALQRDRADQPLARARAGRGGGLEYHRSLLPPSALLDLSRRDAAQAQPIDLDDTADAARPADARAVWFAGQTAAVKAEAAERLRAVQEVEDQVAAGFKKGAAVTIVAGRRNISQGTLWAWLKMVAGVAKEDRLAALAPRRKGGGAEAEVCPQAWKYFLSDYLRLEHPTLAACYDRLLRAAPEQGFGHIPHWKTLQRKIDREIDPMVVELARYGQDALRGMVPPSKRTVEQMHALQCVNADGHKWDVFVRFEDGRVGRPLMVAIQDIYSRKMLAWRIGETESAHDVRLAFAKVLKQYGIPQEAVLDNGRAFASKWITGGTANRFRFKVQPGDPVGLLTDLGVKIHWTIPYRGQSKPIERAFKDLCGRVATHPAFAGAYVGNKPDAKPENYGSRAIPIAEFRRVVDQEIAAHNARQERRTEMGAGKYSFDQVFNDSYAVSPIGKVTADQLRLALLAADKVSAHRKTGAFDLFGNRYWSRDSIHLAGQKLVVRFDPDDLHSVVHAYAMDSRYLGAVPIDRAVGFLDVDAAKARARLDGDVKRTAKQHLKALNLRDAADIAAMLPQAPEVETPQPKVTRMVRRAGALAVKTDPETEAAPGFMDRFVGGTERRSELLKLVE